MKEPSGVAPTAVRLDDFLPTRGLVDRWPLIFGTEQTVRRHRMAGTGPRFTVINGKVYYRTGDVEEWLRSRPYFNSTAERKVAAEAGVP